MPLSFIWGEEDFLIEKEINAVKQKVLGDNIFLTILFFFFGPSR